MTQLIYPPQFNVTVISKQLKLLSRVFYSASAIRTQFCLNYNCQKTSVTSYAMHIYENMIKFN